MRLSCNSGLDGLVLKSPFWRLTMGIGGRSGRFSHDGAGWFGFGTFWAGKETPIWHLGDKK